jgi:DNA polymerase I
MLFLINYSYDNDLTFWFYDDITHTITRKSKKEIEKELNIQEHYPYLLTKDEVILQTFGVLKIEPIIKYNIIHDRYENLYKISVSNPSIIYDKRSKTGLRTKLRSSYEDDIKYPYCFAYDNRLIFGYQYPNGLHSLTLKPNDRSSLFQLYKTVFNLYVPKVKYVALDIEVRTNQNKYPDVEKAEQPIVACSFCSDDYRKVFMLKDSHLIVQSANDKEIEYFKDERELLKKTFSIINSYPFVLGFNSDNFDLQYLHNRAKRLQIESPIKMEKTETQIICNLKNSIHLDVYKILTHSLFKPAFKQLEEAENNTLEEIARVLLNETKEPMPDLNLCTDIALKKRCLKDSEIVYKIAQKDNYKIFKLLFLFSRITNISLQDIYRINLTKIIAKYQMNWIYRLFNTLIPNKKDLTPKTLLPIKKSNKKENSYEGAITLEPEPNAYFNVYVLDVPSMYPNVIDKFNIGPETLACPHKECKTNIAPEHSFHICTKNKSLFSMTIGCLKDLRIEMKHNNADPSFIETLKLHCNSSYGIYKNIIPAVASTITACARYSFRQMMKIAEKHNIKVLYGDTDSLFIKTDKPENIQKFIDDVHNQLKIKLDVQKNYKLCILWKKKNYLGITKENKCDIVGLVGKKKDVCMFFKKVFIQIAETLKNVNNTVELEHAKHEIRKILNESHKQLRMRNFKLEELIIKRRLKKDDGEGQDYEVARQYRELGIHKKAGDYIHKILVNDKRYTAKPYETVKDKNNVNVEKYIELLDSLVSQVTIPLKMNIGAERTLTDYIDEEIKLEFEDDIIHFNFE